MNTIRLDWHGLTFDVTYDNEGSVEHAELVMSNADKGRLEDAIEDELQAIADNARYMDWEDENWSIS